MMNISRRFGVPLITSVMLSACVQPEVAPLASEFSASVGGMTAQNRALRQLPAAQERIPVAVYDFPDLTGQFREKENVQTLSKVVSQGGSQILIKALQDAGQRHWFTVLDRSNLEDLIRERQIVTEMRRVYRNEGQIDPDALPPLLHAGIIVQGGIIGYDSNFVTGGAGARYLGIGLNQRWKLDIVMVSMQAVSSHTGEVLASVVVRKPIASRALQGSVFSYVALDELLEAETGWSINEPKQVALEQAVEKAVMALIAEGADLGVWAFRNRADGQRFIAGFKAQQYDGNVPANATARARPITRNPADVVRTVPITSRKRPVASPSMRQLPASETIRDNLPMPAPPQNEEPLG